MMAASTPAMKLRVLCLHSFRTSGEILRRQVARAKWDVHLGVH